MAAIRNAQGRTANTDAAAWTLTAPASESVSGATIWRAGDTAGGYELNAGFIFWLAGPKANQLFDTCAREQLCAGEGNAAQALAPENRVVVPASALGEQLFMSASCSGVSEYRCPESQADPNGYAAVVYLFAADLTLEQTAGPSATGVSGELASAPAVAGTSDVAFAASDPGAGVYQAEFSIDGQVVQRTVVNEDGGRCRNVGQTADGTPAFLYLQPCLASVSADVGLDTTRIANGPHHLVVDVLDAAGNSAPVLDRQVTIANPPPPGVPGPANGINASATPSLAVRWSRTSRPAMTGSFGRAQTVAGRLTAPGGVPIADAAVEVRATPADPSGTPVFATTARSGADGRFTIRLPARLPSSSVRFAYRTHLGDPLPAVTRTLRLSVRAAVALRIAPRTAGVGQSILFRGRLLGGPVPRDGKQLVLEARSPGGQWIEFKVVRSDRRGRYRATYRFRFPGPATYQFRVLSEPESDYPFAEGSSQVLAVHEHS